MVKSFWFFFFGQYWFSKLIFNHAGIYWVERSECFSVLLSEGLKGLKSHFLILKGWYYCRIYTNSITKNPERLTLCKCTNERFMYYSFFNKLWNLNTIHFLNEKLQKNSPSTSSLYLGLQKRLDFSSTNMIFILW